MDSKDSRCRICETKLCYFCSYKRNNSTIKAYTDIDQSKKLAEIMPLESADMYYKYVLPKSDKIHYIPEIGNPINSLKWYNEGYTFSGKRKPITLNDYCIPCWSLAALLDVLPEGTNVSTPNPINELSYCCWNHYDEIYASNAVDACYEMIIRLNELKML